MTSVLVGRDAEVRRARRALLDGPGVVVVGAAGLGASSVVREAVEQLDVDPCRIQVGESSHELRLRELVPAITEPRPSTPVVVVDDAHRLDPSSVESLYDLVVLGRVRVAATCRIDGPNAMVPSLSRLWTHAGCERIELTPLDRPTVGELSQHLLGDRVTHRAEHALWTLSAGNPLMLRELIAAGIESGSLQHSDGGWHLDGEIPNSSRLADLVATRVERLPPPARDAVEILALAEPVDPQLLHEAVDANVADELERSGLLATRRETGARTAMTFTHPLYGEVVRTNMSVGRRARWSRNLVDAGSRRPHVPVDPIQLATWRLDGGVIDGDALLDAADAALSRQMWARAAAFAGAAAAHTDRHRVSMALGRALMGVGTPEAMTEAISELRRAVDLAHGEDERVEALISTARAMMGSDTDAAVTMLSDELASPHLRATARARLTAALSHLHMLVGDVGLASALARDVSELDEADADTHLAAIISGSLSDAIQLRLDQAHAGIERGRTLAANTPSTPPITVDLLDANRCAAAILGGDLHQARSAIDQRRSAALADDDLLRLALWTLLDAQVTLAGGAAQRSRELADEAIRLSGGSDPLGIGPLAAAEAAHASGVLGDAAGARRRLTRIDRRWRSTRRVAPRVAAAEAWATLVESGATPAVDLAIRSAEQAERDGVIGWAVEAWHLAVRLGRGDRVADRLRGIADESGVGYVALLADHAEAADEPERLDDVARRFRNVGRWLLAAEAFAQAAAAFRRHDAGEQARRAAARGLDVLGDDLRAATPVLVELRTAVGLTPRQREIALMAADGFTSRDIAERLGLSRRTVDNRLAQVYARLGVDGRHELADVLSPHRPGEPDVTRPA